MLLKNQIFVVRHGQSENNVLGIESGNIDTQGIHGLTDLGRKQAKISAQQHDNFDLIFTSPFRRAIETAEFFRQSSGLEQVTTDVRIQEFNIGTFDLKPYEESEIFIHDNNTCKLTTPIGGGESFEAMASRVRDFLQDLNVKFQNKKILLVSHGSPIEALIQIKKGTVIGFGPFEDLPKNGEIICLNEI